jgi:hypothetical protein
MHNHRRNDASDLDWLALQYVSGEMNEVESAEFEERLADDQAAREAVASAVELVQTVSAAEHLVELPIVTTAARQASWWRSVAWLAIAGGVAASIALVAMLGSMPHDDGDNSTAELAAPSTMKAADQTLAAAWVETFEDASLAVDPTLDFAMDSPADERAELESLLADDSATVAAPDWMVSALAGMSGLDLEGRPEGALEN